MATYTSPVTNDVVTSELRRQSRARKSSAPEGPFMFKTSNAVTAASYDVIGDYIQLAELPDKFYPTAVSVVADKDFDTGGTAVRFDLVLKAGTAFTSGVGVAFAAQPANEKVEILSDAAGDTTQKVTIVGITTGTDTVVVEEMTLNGTTQVDSVKADWGVILAAWVSSGTLTAASTVTIREASGNATITTLTPAITSRGVETVTSTDYNGVLVDLVCSGTGTKQIGIKGTDNAGAVQYDSQALNGVTVVTSNLPFATVTAIYTGDLEATRTVTVNPGDRVLVAASAAFSTNPATPISYGSGALFGNEVGTDASDHILALRVNVAPTTANTGTVVFTTTVDGYIFDKPLPVLS